MSFKIHIVKKSTHRKGSIAFSICGQMAVGYSYSKEELFKDFPNTMSSRFCKSCIKKVDSIHQIEDGEWYYKGCFITSVNHPNLPHKYEVRQDNESQTFAGVSSNLKDAQLIAEWNEVKTPKNGLFAYI